MTNKWENTNALDEVEALVATGIQRLRDPKEPGRLSRSRKASLVLLCAADIIISANRYNGGPIKGNADAVGFVYDKARRLLGYSETEIQKLSFSTRVAIRSAIFWMLTACQPRPPELAAWTPASEKRNSVEAVDIDPSEALQGGVYEILVGTGYLGWKTSTPCKGKWHAEPGCHFLAYQSSVTRVRIHGSIVGEQVTNVLRYYAELLPELGEEQADAKCRDDIRRAADWLIYRDVTFSPRDPVEHSESWWRVHDAILRGYLRWKIHIDDTPPRLAAA